MNESNNPLDRDIIIKNITDAVVKMPDHKGFLKLDKKRGIRPAFSKEINAVYLLMHWPMFNMPGIEIEQNREIDEVSENIEKEEDVPNHGLSLYAALMPHGKTYVAETFFADEVSGNFMGTHAVFSIDFPANEYNEDYDPWLIEELANKVLGVHREKTLGHQLTF